MYQAQTFRKKNWTFQTPFTVLTHISNMLSSLWSQWNKCAWVCGCGEGWELAQLNVTRTQELCSNAYVFCQGQGQIPMCLLGKRLQCSYSPDWKQAAWVVLLMPAITWIPRGSTCSLSKHVSLGGNTDKFLGCLGVADTRQLTLYKSIGLSFEDGVRWGRRLHY